MISSSPQNENSRTLGSSTSFAAGVFDFASYLMSISSAPQPFIAAVMDWMKIPAFAQWVPALPFCLVCRFCRLSAMICPSPEKTWHSRSEEHTSELQSLRHLVCRLLLEKKQHRHHRRLAAGVGLPRTDPALAGRHGAGDGAHLSGRSAGLLGIRHAL